MSNSTGIQPLVNFTWLVTPLLTFLSATSSFAPFDDVIKSGHPSWQACGNNILTKHTYWYNNMFYLYNCGRRGGEINTVSLFTRGHKFLAKNVKTIKNDKILPIFLLAAYSKKSCTVIQLHISTYSSSAVISVNGGLDGFQIHSNILSGWGHWKRGGVKNRHTSRDN